jgi:hypothetical protein
MFMTCVTFVGLVLLAAVVVAVLVSLVNDLCRGNFLGSWLFSADLLECLGYVLMALVEKSLKEIAETLKTDVKTVKAWIDARAK